MSNTLRLSVVGLWHRFVSGNPFVYLFQQTWHYSKGNRKKLAQSYVFFILAISLMLFVLPLCGAMIMNVIQGEGVTRESFPKLLGLLVLMFLTKCVFWMFHGPARVWETINAFKARRNYRLYLLKGILGLPMGWHVEHHSGNTIDQVEKGTTALFQFSAMSFQVVYALVQLVGSFLMLAYFFPESIPVVIGVMCASIYLTMRFDRVMIPQYKELNKAENEISKTVLDTITNITTVIILRVERLVFEGIAASVDKPYQLFRRNTKLNEWKWFLTTVCTAILTLVVMTWYFWRHLDASKTAMVGTAYVLLKYLEEMGDVFFRFAGMYADGVVRKTRIGNAEELTEDFGPENSAKHVLPSDWQHVLVKNLDFTYPGGEGLHLNGVTLDIKRGQRVALVGPTGCGKTTLLKVIRGLYRACGVKLTVDGTEIDEGFDGICEAIALVPQDPEIFGTTVLNNMTLGARYDQALIDECIAMACFGEVVKKLPKGLLSSLNERGVNLSGGQKQRLALVRGLLACQGKSIALFDEPTSSLDATTEREVYRRIFGRFPDTTIISSIHRLHLLPLFDVIHFFSEGKLIASGTLDQLRACCPEFQALWEQYNSQPEAAAA